MKIYIQSRGYSSKSDYCWMPEIPPHLTDISIHIQSESSSLVLARFDKQLMLLVTGLESLEKKDFRDRPIRHSVAWVCDKDDNKEKQIRAIAVQGLRGLLSTQVDSYIQFSDKSKFGFEASKIEELSQVILNKMEIESQLLDSSEIIAKIANNSPSLRNSLASQLQQYSLPEDYKILIVATGIKPEYSLLKAFSWRSLSNLVKSENWKDIPKEESQPPNFKMAILAIVAVLVIAIIILEILLLHPFPPILEIAPTLSPTPTLIR